MESLSATLIYYLSILLLLFPLTLADTTATSPTTAPSGIPSGIPSGTIQRTTRQQILASIAPNAEPNSVPFLSSPSGKYVAYFLRHETAAGAGGFGNDFCYIQILDASSGESLWESECTPVSTENTCALVFSDFGLAVFDGSNSAWDTGAESADNNPLETLELVDQGDMRLRDQVGELAWKASEKPLANQGCGLPGSAGLAPARPPFAEPIGGRGGKNMPFGQHQPQQQEGGNVLSGGSQSIGADGQPLVDDNSYYSGCLRAVEAWVGTVWALLVATLVVYVLYF